jgi:hypothetical protein
MLKRLALAIAVVAMLLGTAATGAAHKGEDGC